MKKFLLLSVVTTLFCGCIGWGWGEPAYDFKVDDICYHKLDSKNVEVTYETFSSAGAWSNYKGDIVVPATVTYENITYNVTAIGHMAFWQCQDLLSVTLPDGITTIGSDAFDYCHKLKTIDIPSSVSTIEYGAFRSCSSLNNIIFREGILTIAEGAFSGCGSLTAIHIPASVTSLGKYAFSYCPNLKSISVEASNIVYHSQDSCIIHTETKTLYLGCQTSIIPVDGSVTKIGSDAFAGCEYLSAITIPACVTQIEILAFAYCRNLAEIIVLNPIPPIIDEYSFYFDYIYACNAVLYVPAESIDAYKNAPHWENFINIQAIE